VALIVWPKLEQVTDRFSYLSGTWEFTPANASIATGGRLQTLSAFFDHTDPMLWNNRSGGELWSAQAGGFEGSHATVELWDTDSTASGVTHLAVFTGTSSPHVNGVAWETRYDPVSAWGFVLQAVRTVAGARTILATLHPDRQESRYLRLRQNAGVIRWDTSPDGFTWTTAASWTSTLNLTAARIALGSWYTSPGDVGGDGSTWDNLNIPLGELDPVTLTGDDGEPYLAVDVQPDNITGAFRVGTSVIGGPDRLAWSTDEPSTWVNVVCSVRTVEYQRGATKELGLLTTTEAGTATVVVEDTAGQFDPNLNGDAIRKGTPWRLRAWGTDMDGQRWDAVLFTGELDTLDAQYLPDEDAPLVTLTAVDLVGPLTAWESEGLAGDGDGAGDNLLQRAQRILTTVGRGEVSSASSSAYAATLAPTPLAKPWDELQQATEAELGRVWVDRHNRLQLRARGSQPLGAVRGTLSDVHPAADVGVHQCMEDARVVRGTDGVVNRVLARRRKLSTDAVDPVQARRDDELSQRMYGVATANRQDLVLQTDAQVTAWAGALITARTRPELRVDSVTPRPQPAELDLALQQWPAVLSTDIGDRWLFQLHPSRGGAIVRGLAVLGIHVTASPDGWSVQWVTEAAAVPGAANPTGWYVVGLSMIGGSDVLAPYPAPYAAA
jgi:hypothetical protein